MVIWVTGLSGAGKTALCAALYEALKPRLPALVRLDGDAMREMWGEQLGYREADRRIHISRVQRLAKLLADQGLVVLVAALYVHPELLAWNRTHLPGYVEIYLNASLELVRRRDVKQLYARAARGEIRDVVGVDIPWHTPTAPDLVIDVDHAPAPEVLARQVLDAIPRLSRRVHTPVSA